MRFSSKGYGLLEEVIMKCKKCFRVYISARSKALALTIAAFIRVLKLQGKKGNIELPLEEPVKEALFLLG